MPKCVERRADTTPMPNSRAMSIASCMARVPIDEAEAVLAVEGGRDRRHALGCEIGLGIDQARAHALKIDRQAAEAVGVDAAQIGADETAGDDGGILRRHAMGLQQRARESIGGDRAGVDQAGGGLRPGHQSLMSLICLARAVAAPSRNARSVPVET